MKLQQSWQRIWELQIELPVISIHQSGETTPNSAKQHKIGPGSPLMEHGAGLSSQNENLYPALLQNHEFHIWFFF